MEGSKQDWQQKITYVDGPFQSVGKPPDKQTQLHKAFIKYILYYILVMIFIGIDFLTPRTTIPLGQVVCFLLAILCAIISVVYHVIIFRGTKNSNNQDYLFYRRFIKMILLALLIGFIVEVFFEGLINGVLKYNFLNGHTTEFCYFLWVAITVILGLAVTIEHKIKK